MSAPTIDFGPPLGIVDALERFAPAQGGIEFQTDQPGKVHAWHSHSASETLVILEGQMTLEWTSTWPAIEANCRTVSAGAVIRLPAHTIHQSVTGQDMCRYLILPEDGQTVHTRIYE